jgi:1-acyl-sn-glycerol-3-phosphate acyltransferase
MKYFWKFYLKLFGWKTDISFPYHNIKKYIIILAPHTSNWDFVIGLAYRSLVGLNRSKFLGKKELFAAPFGWIFRKLGGIPADRSHHSNLVDESVRLFNEKEEFVLALSPEGTRARVDKLKTGFYFIARQAKVPIIMVGLDWKNRTIIFSEPFMASEQDIDFTRILSFYKPIHGKYPGQGLMK